MNSTVVYAAPPSLAQVTDVLARHAPLYRKRAPAYQTAMLRDLAAAWSSRHSRVLDVGGGTGVMAEAIQTLLPADEVVAIDVVDRYFDTISVETRTYDGVSIPFADASFDAATINNVMHHVPPDTRSSLMAELARVVTGPIYIKDHVAVSALDHARLWALDAIGNIPFGGQVDADYLGLSEWEDLASGCGRILTRCSAGPYRRAPMSWFFPNRLEAVFRLDAPVQD